VEDVDPGEVLTNQEGCIKSKSVTSLGVLVKSKEVLLDEVIES